MKQGLDSSSTQHWKFLINLPTLTDPREWCEGLKPGACLGLAEIVEFGEESSLSQTLHGTADQARGG